MKHGKGKFIWKDGSSYEGEFENNIINGYGRLTSSYYLTLKANMFGVIIENMKDNGLNIKCKEKESLLGQTEKHMKECTKMI